MKWTSAHSLSVNYSAHSHTEVHPNAPVHDSGSTAVDSQTRNLRAQRRSACSQRGIHQTRLFESFQAICGSPRGAAESKRHSDFAAAVRANSDQQHGVVDDKLSREIAEILACAAPWHANAPNGAASGGHCAANGDSLPPAGPAAPPRPLACQRGQPQAC